jgi:Tfp pilus assembly protein PilX
MSARNKRRSQGFSLFTALLLLTIMAALSVSVLLLVRTETVAGANDLQNKAAYHAAEGALEKMTADLSNVFTAIQAPQVSDITNVSTLTPTVPGITYPEYSVTPALNADGSLNKQWHQIASGTNQDLYAQTIPVTLSVTAQTGLGDQVRMVRTAEIALIPVFQFGVFSQSDIGFFSSPDMNFAGRVHTNGDLFLGVSSSATLSFQDKLAAYGNVIRARLPNGLASSSNNNTGSVYIQAQAGGCDALAAGGSAGTNCKTIASTEGSVIDGPTSAQNSGWNSVSKTKFNGQLIDGNYGRTGGTGATCMTLSFTNQAQNCPSGPGQTGSTTPDPNNQNFEIIRMPPSWDTASSPIGQARLYNQAEIRILLADDPAELGGSGRTDPDNIRLANVQTSGIATAPDYSKGVPTSVPTTLAALSGGRSYTTYFAEATDLNTAGIQETTPWTTSYSTALTADWPKIPLAPPSADVQTLWANATPAGGAGSPVYTTSPNNKWNLIDGYIRVEYRDSTDTWHPATREWLELGFARGLTPPKSGSLNTVNPKAILIMQEPADRDGDGTLDPNGTAHTFSSGHWNNNEALPPEVRTDTNTSTYYYGDGGSGSHADSVTRTNWYPINFYDSREGEPRDATSTSCTVNGIMNAVELDMYNLKRWLAGTIGANGTSVKSSEDNGYIVYFSDRRGMLVNANAVKPNPAGAGNISDPRKTGDSGLEDVVNATSSSGAPDGALETPGGVTSPEDVNANGLLDNYGAKNLGYGFYYPSGGGYAYVSNTVSGTPTPYGDHRVDCLSVARKNRVSGARHVLRLVNGSLGNIATKSDGTGGLTVGSENPLYILGDYNSNSTDASWAGGTEPAHAAAGVIADAVTLLSNSWTDMQSFQYPSNVSSHKGATATRYRLAIAAGKNKTFPAPSYINSSTYGFGTDGGVHNFLRFLEDWTGDDAYYKGSMVSLFYSTYSTGTFKCCNSSVYRPPQRHFYFDPLFSDYSKLPPGTPSFRDVNNLSYRQDFTPR